MCGSGLMKLESLSSCGAIGFGKGVVLGLGVG